MLESTQKYDPPYNAKQIKDNYGDEIYNRLVKDPVHKWRMDTGIELIHKEPSKEELERIWKNWNLMSDEDKRKSDEKSRSLFGLSNGDHYKKLIKESEVLDEGLIKRIGQHIKLKKKYGTFKYGDAYDKLKSSYRDAGMSREDARAKTEDDLAEFDEISHPIKSKIKTFDMAPGDVTRVLKVAQNDTRSNKYKNITVPAKNKKGESLNIQFGHGASTSDQTTHKKAPRGGDNVDYVATCNPSGVGKLKAKSKHLGKGSHETTIRVVGHRDEQGTLPEYTNDGRVRVMVGAGSEKAFNRRNTRELKKINDSYEIVKISNSMINEDIDKKSLQPTDKILKRFDPIGLKESVSHETSLNKQDILKILSTLGYNKSDYWISYKAALVLYGIVENTNDIDLCCNRKMMDSLEKDGYVIEKAPIGDIRKAIINDRIECFENNRRPTIKINGYNVETVDSILKLYKDMNREKDQKTIAAIEKYMELNESEILGRRLEVLVTMIRDGKKEDNKIDMVKDALKEDTLLESPVKKGFHFNFTFDLDKLIISYKRLKEKNRTKFLAKIPNDILVNLDNKEYLENTDYIKNVSEKCSRVADDIQSLWSKQSHKINTIMSKLLKDNVVLPEQTVYICEYAGSNMGNNEILWGTYQHENFDTMVYMIHEALHSLFGYQSGIDEDNNNPNGSLQHSFVEMFSDVLLSKAMKSKFANDVHDYDRKIIEKLKPLFNIYLGDRTTSDGLDFLREYDWKEFYHWCHNNFDRIMSDNIFESVMIEEIKQKTVLDKARDIMEKMNDIEYGSVYVDGRKSKRDRDDWYDDSNKFCPQPVLSVLKHKMGHCIDQSELERYYFKKANIKHKVFSMFPERGSNMYHNHTFLVFFDENDTPYWFDHAWYSERGIHKGESLNELFKKICDKKRKADPQNDPENAERFKHIKYEIFEVPQKSCLSWDDYVEWVWRQKLVYKG